MEQNLISQRRPGAGLLLLLSRLPALVPTWAGWGGSYWFCTEKENKRKRGVSTLLVAMLYSTLVQGPMQSLKTQSHTTPVTMRSGLCSRAVAPSSPRATDGRGHPHLAYVSN